MSRCHIISSAVWAAVLALFSILPGTLEASEIETNIFTFQAPVQLPGHILPAGTYLFRLAQSTSEMNVVEIKNPQETKVYGVFLVKPEYHTRLPKRSTIIFEKRGPGPAQAIKAWYYGGSKYFNDFIYPR